jgi:hypothetical protein
VAICVVGCYWSKDPNVNRGLCSGGCCSSINGRLSTYIQRLHSLNLSYCNNISGRGPGSSVGIATGYGLDVPGIESRWR